MRVLGAPSVAVLVVVGGLAVAPPVGAAQPEDGLPDGFDAITQLDGPAPSRGPTLGVANGELRELVVAAEVEAAGEAPASVHVEVLHDLSSAAIRDVIEDLGGTVTGEVPGVLAEADVPVRSLAALEATVGVRYSRPPVRVDIPVADGPRAGGVTGEQIALTNAGPWHANGYTGAGVQVGIIDFYSGPAWQAAQASGDLPAPAGAFCRIMGQDCTNDIFTFGVNHGVQVAEVIYDMAPSVSFYVASAVTPADINAAVDYFAAQGVDIISRSQGAQYDGAGDGTGALDTVVDKAIGLGMLWVNSAGNSGVRAGSGAGAYWRGPAVDTDADGYLEFAGGDETLAYTCTTAVYGVRWDDWGPVRTDYDVYAYLPGQYATPVAFSEGNQGAGMDPLEWSEGFACDDSVQVLELVIFIYAQGDGVAGDIVEFQVNGAPLEHSSNPYAAAVGAVDSANPGALAVGAIDPAASQTAADYTSQGPTNANAATGAQERIKPDLSAPACLMTVTGGGTCFDGTSSSTPVVAGAAALVRQAGLGASPAALGDYLRTNTQDRGTPGADNVYGRGQLFLPAPPPPAPPPPPPPPPASQAGHTYFVDVFASDFYDAAVGRLVEAGLTNGCSPGYYCPEGYVTRGEMAVFLSRLLVENAGFPVGNTFGHEVFVDVPIGVFYDEFVGDIYAHGLTAGCIENVYYCPDGLVTRGEMAVFLGRIIVSLFGYPPGPHFGSQVFYDVYPTDFFDAAVGDIADYGITAGCAAGAYCPFSFVTRGEMAVFLSKVLDLIP